MNTHYLTQNGYFLKRLWVLATHRSGTSTALQDVHLIREIHLSLSTRKGDRISRKPVPWNGVIFSNSY